jgi:hypothetical protein
MSRFFRLFSSVLLLSFFVADAALCQSQASCPVLATLATSKRPWPDGGEHIVIWFFNQGQKTTRGIQFELFMLDAVGNRYPASQKYIATGETQPQKGDVVDYPTDTEKLHFSEGWSVIDGVEVRVTRVMFKDNTVWVPQKVQPCKTVFMNDDYDAALEKRWKAVEKKMQEEKQERKN